MLENFIWKNVLLPEFIKKEVVSFYENKCTNPYLYQRTKSLKKSFIHFICNQIHKKWFNQNSQEKNPIVLKEISQYLQRIELPMSFWLLLAKTDKVHKFQKLLEWGFNIKKSFSVQDLQINMFHQVLWAYHQDLINETETKEIINALLKENITLFEKDYKISHYEKANALIKNDEVNNILTKKKRLIDLINSWIDNDLYLFLLKSNLSENDKAILEYISLKKKVHTIYIEKFSGSNRKSGHDNIMRQMGSIEEIIKRNYIFNNQSASFNSLSLILNIPDMNDLLSNVTTLYCYQEFSKLKTTGKKAIVSDLINKNKDVILFNLLNYGANINWNIKTEQGENILGLELLTNMDFIEHILVNENFKITNANKEGNNLLHLIGSLPLQEEKLKLLLKNRIEDLTELQKNFLFHQFNKNNLTPMLKAIEDENIQLIQLLSEVGNSGVEEISGIEKVYASPLNFIQNILEEIHIGVKVTEILNILTQESEKEKFLHSLYKNWSIEKNYNKMKEKLSGARKKDKLIKI